MPVFPILIPTAWFRYGAAGARHKRRDAARTPLAAALGKTRARRWSIALASALALGLASPAAWAQASSGTAELLALGDSLTQGYGLPQNDGLVPQLQAWLNAHRGADAPAVTVINAGVSGDTTAGGRARLDWSITPQTRAVIVTLGGNDVLRGLPPEQARANLEAMLQDLHQRALPVLLVGVPVPGNYGPRYQSDFRAIWPDLAARYDTLLLPDLPAPILARPAPERQALIQADGIHPSAAGVKLIMESLGPKVAELLARAGL